MIRRYCGLRFLFVTVLAGMFAGTALADTFGTGTNRFTMDFVTISGATNPTSGIPADNFTFTGVNNDYRMGKFEVTNDQWNKFKAAYGTVTGTPSNAYDQSPSVAGTNLPTNNVSWYEAAQFVNWLNTSTGHPVAYKFTGTQSTSNYTLATWSTAEADNGINLYRNKDAKYYLPNENEWLKAAYWNGTTLQTYATKAGDTLRQGNGTNGGWNYYTNSGSYYGEWNVGSGSEELNGTFDMMGNVWEWMENPWNDPNYTTYSNRGMRGGSCMSYASNLASSARGSYNPSYEYDIIGFRVASEVPEPCSMALLAFGGMATLRRKRS